MKVLKDKTEYMVVIKGQNLKDIWWLCNKYLIDHPNPKDEYDSDYRAAKWVHENFKFVIE